MSTPGETLYMSSTPADSPPWVVRPTSHEHCMVCGAHPSFGLRFRPVTPHCVEATFTADARWQGYAGLMHGGMISTLLDAAMTHCLFNIGIEALTASLDIRFVEPIDCRSELLLRAELRSRKRKLYCVYAEIMKNHRRLAHGNARFLSRATKAPSNGLSCQLENVHSTKPFVTQSETPL